MTRIVRLLAALGASAVVAAACSPEGSTTTAISHGRGGSGNAGGGAGPGELPGGPLLDGAPGTDDNPSCSAFKEQGRPQPVDIFIMLDRSLTMAAGGRWAAVTQALTQFVNDPATAGIGVGIQYFGQPSGAPPLCDNPMSSQLCTSLNGICTPPVPPYFPVSVCTGALFDSCDVTKYATPAVPIAPLPGNAFAITASIKANGPFHETPTAPALTGAIQYATSWQMQNPDHKTVVLFATDGDPFGCAPSDRAGIAAIAAAGHAGGIDTYIIGMQGASKANLDAWAAAGGTGQAYDASDPSKFIQQMNAIRGAIAGCTYEVPVPDAGRIDYNQVKVVATIDDVPATLTKVAGATECGASGGWYFDENSPPKAITVCPQVCDSLRTAKTMAGIELDLGCLIVTN